jgi:hypothetical protein
MDPATITALLTPVVSLLTGYMTYKVGMRKAQDEGKPQPEQPKEADKAEQALVVVKEAVAAHGDDAVKQTLALFEQQPQAFASAFREMLAANAQRNPAFAQQLQTLIIGDQVGGDKAGGDKVAGNKVDGSVHVAGDAKVYGTVAGVNTETIATTYNFGKDDTR